MNGHDFTLEQNTEARMMLAAARRVRPVAGRALGRSRRSESDTV